MKNHSIFQTSKISSLLLVLSISIMPTTSFASVDKARGYQITINNQDSKKILENIKDLINASISDLVSTRIQIRKRKTTTTFCLRFKSDAADQLDLLESDLSDLSFEYINSDLNFGAAKCKTETQLVSGT